MSSFGSIPRGLKSQEQVDQLKRKKSDSVMSRTTNSRRESPRSKSSQPARPNNSTDRGRPPHLKKISSRARVTSVTVETETTLLDDKVQSMISNMIHEGISTVLGDVIGDVVSDKIKDLKGLVTQLSQRIEILENDNRQQGQTASFRQKLFPTVQPINKSSSPSSIPEQYVSESFREDSSSSPIIIDAMEKTLIGSDDKKRNSTNINDRISVTEPRQSESDSTTTQQIRESVLKRMAKRGKSVDRTVKKLSKTWKDKTTRSKSRERKQQEGTSLDSMIAVNEKKKIQQQSQKSRKINLQIKTTPPNQTNTEASVIRMEDLSGKWYQNKIISSSNRTNPPVPPKIWIVNTEGVATLQENAVLKANETCLHFHEELSVHSPSSSTSSSTSSSSSSSTSSSSSSQHGGWIIHRGDGWKLDSYRSDLTNQMVWKRDIDREVEGGNATYELDTWKRCPDSPGTIVAKVNESSSSLSPSLLSPSSSPQLVAKSHKFPAPPALLKSSSVIHTPRNKKLVEPFSPMSPKAAQGFWKVMKKGVLSKVLAGLLSKAVKEIEPKITELLTDIAQRADGELVGLEYKFKSQESLFAKIDRDVHDANLKVLENMEKRRRRANSVVDAQTIVEKNEVKIRRASAANLKALKRDSNNQDQLQKAMMDGHKQADIEAKKSAALLQDAVNVVQEEAEKEGKNEIDLHAIVWDISDALRYTVLIKTKNYTEAVRNAVETLQKAGLEAHNMKNYWGEGDGYQGINDVFLVPCKISSTGKVKVEIQFHTPESFEHKMAVHGMYEEFRSTHDPTRKVELWQESVAMADTIPVPFDVLSLPVLKTQPMPIETTLYVDLVVSRALKIQQPALTVVNRVIKQLKLPDFMNLESGNNNDDEMSMRKVKAKVTSHLMSPSSIEMRINNEMLHPNHKLRGSIKNIENESEIQELKLKDAALRINDAIVINIIFDINDYATATELAMEELFKNKKGDGDDDDDDDSNSSSELVEVKTSNAWMKPTLFKRTGPSGGVGVYCHVTMEGEDDGVAFTPDDAYPLVIAFHTSESLSARVGLQSAWADYRSANTRKQRNAALLKSQRLTSDVTVPVGARGVRGQLWLKQMTGNDSDSDEEDEDSDSDDDI